MHRLLGNGAKKEEYKRTSPYHASNFRQARKMFLGELCCQPYLMKDHLVLDTSANPSYCSVTLEIQNLMPSLNSWKMKHAAIGNSPENHVTGLTLHLQIKYFLIRQYRPCQTKLSLLNFLLIIVKKKFVSIIPKLFVSVKLFKL